MRKVLNLPNGNKLHVTESFSTLVRHAVPIKSWRNDALGCEYGSKEFEDKVLARARLWLARSVIQPDRSGWHLEDYETLWAIMDDDGQAVPCPKGLLETEEMARRTLKALMDQPKTLNLSIVQPIGENRNKYYKLTIVVTDPEKNGTLPELHDNMRNAVRDAFPGMDQDDWPVLVQYVPLDISDGYGFRVTNDPETHQIKTEPRKGT